MKHPYQRFGALVVIGLTMAGALYLLNPRLEKIAAFQLVQMPGGDLTALVSSVHEHLGVTDWPDLPATSVDVVHMHGSPVFGQMLALRLNGIRIDATTLRADATGDQVTGDAHRFFQRNTDSPQWLKTPWIDADGSSANRGSATTETLPGATLTWYVRPDAQELILYLDSSDELAISTPMRIALASADYVSMTPDNAAGNDPTTWARLRLSPLN